MESHRKRHTLIASMFDRLPREARHAGDLTRLVGYEISGQGADRLRFFGLEVEAIEGIPEGLFAWELGAARYLKGCVNGKRRCNLLLAKTKRAGCSQEDTALSVKDTKPHR